MASKQQQLETPTTVVSLSCRTALRVCPSLHAIVLHCIAAIAAIAAIATTATTATITAADALARGAKVLEEQAPADASALYLEAVEMYENDGKEAQVCVVCVWGPVLVCAGGHSSRQRHSQRDSQSLKHSACAHNTCAFSCLLPCILPHPSTPTPTQQTPNRRVTYSGRVLRCW